MSAVASTISLFQISFNELKNYSNSYYYLLLLILVKFYFGVLPFKLLVFLKIKITENSILQILKIL